MHSIPFTKMHGAGNDFVIIDARDPSIKLPALNIFKLSHRRRGIGCDQVIWIEPPKMQKEGGRHDAFMRIFNADGSESGMCGNAARCVAWVLMREQGVEKVHIETLSGLLECVRAGDQRVTVNMGSPKLGWQDIPLSREQDTLHLGIGKGTLGDPVGVSMGNPHMVFFVDDITQSQLEVYGPDLERHPLFPQRANVTVAQVVPGDEIYSVVWERGVGETLSCGSAACATLVAAVRRKLIGGRKAVVRQPGGELVIEWTGSGDSGQVLMTGPVAVSFTGTFDAESYKP